MGGETTPVSDGVAISTQLGVRACGGHGGSRPDCTEEVQMVQASATDMAATIRQMFAKFPTQSALGYTDREWTKQIMGQLGELGVAHGWEVCAGGFSGRFERGWLYDLVWYRNEPRGDSSGNLAEVFLVLECEWQKNLRSIKFDFEKLLLAKAALKVMIFQSHNRNASTHVAELRKAIDMFHARDSSEIYILASFNNSTYQFDVHQITGDSYVEVQHQPGG
jgi:hypothetical protein